MPVRTCITTLIDNLRNFTFSTKTGLKISYLVIFERNAMTKSLIDDVTGEIFSLEKGTKIITPNGLKQMMKKQDAIALPKGEEFIKVFKESLPQLASCGLTTPEARVFFYLLENVRYGSNVAKHDNGKLITREHIIETLDMPASNVHRALVKLCQRGLIAIAKIDIGKVFIVNPFVAMRGSTIDKTTYDLFKKTKWARAWKIN